VDDGGSNCAGYFEIKIWRGGEMSLYFEVVSSGIHLMGGRCTVWRGEGLTKKHSSIYLSDRIIITLL